MKSLLHKITLIFEDAPRNYYVFGLILPLLKTRTHFSFLRSLIFTVRDNGLKRKFYSGKISLNVAGSKNSKDILTSINMLLSKYELFKNHFGQEWF